MGHSARRERECVHNDGTMNLNGKLLIDFPAGTVVDSQNVLGTGQMMMGNRSDLE